MKTMQKTLRNSLLIALCLALLGGLVLVPQTAWAEEAGETREFTDSAGRTVEVPVNIERVVPSGPLATIFFYTAAPDLLVGLGGPFNERAKDLIPETYYELPITGQFYGGKNATLNLEAILAVEPDIIIDIGEAKDTVVEDMDMLQEQIGVPCVFIEARLAEIPTTYRKLAELLGEKHEERLEDLAVEVESILERAAAACEEIPEDEYKTVYWAMGEKGTNTNARESFQAEALQLLPVVNVADVEAFSRGGGSEVSFEQIMDWDPDVVLVSGVALYEELLADEDWQILRAFEEGKVYVVPEVPYGFLSSPPSVNRIIGVEWLGNLLYPESEAYDFDIEERITELYEKFYSIELEVAAEDEEAVSRIEEILHPELEVEEVEELDAGSGDVIVFAAASMQETMDQIKAQYEELYPEVNIVYTFDSSGTLKTQIEEGAPCDIFISAAQKQMNQLDISSDKNEDKLDYIDPDSRIDLLKNRVTLAVYEGNPKGIESFADLNTDKVASIALGNADVPVGQYSEEALRNMGIWDDILPKVSFATNVKEVTTWVAEQAVDCGIIYATDAFSAGLEIVAEPPEGSLKTDVIYPAAILKEAPNADAAKAFLAYLQTAAAQEIFESVGFVMAK